MNKTAKAIFIIVLVFHVVALLFAIWNCFECYSTQAECLVRASEVGGIKGFSVKSFRWYQLRSVLGVIIIFCSLICLIIVSIIRKRNVIKN